MPRKMTARQVFRKLVDLAYAKQWGCVADQVRSYRNNSYSTFPKNALPGKLIVGLELDERDALSGLTSSMTQDRPEPDDFTTNFTKKS